MHLPRAKQELCYRERGISHTRLARQPACNHLSYSIRPARNPSVDRSGKALGVDAVNPVGEGGFNAQVFANMLSNDLRHLLYIWERLLGDPRSEIDMVQNDAMVSMGARRLRDV